MRIIVLVKTVKFVYAQTGTEIAKNYIGPDDIIHILNPYDELAMEYALKLKDRQAGTKVLALSLGDGFAEEGLRRSLAMGADEAIHIEYEDYENLDPCATASTLAPVCRQSGFDLILCGAEALDDNAGLVGPYVAESLNIPHISRAVKIEMHGKGERVQVHRAVERGDRQILECRLPALLAIEKGTTVPRYPALAGFLRAENWPLMKLAPKDLDLPIYEPDQLRKLTERTALSNPKPKRKKEGHLKKKLSAAERLKLITKREPSKEKEGGKIIEGFSEEMFARLNRILTEAGALSE
jgi:electron transfer flavoprotein beta subunit